MKYAQESPESSGLHGKPTWGSDTALRADPAPLSGAEDAKESSSVWVDPDHPVKDAEPKPPLYKRRWFIISQIILIPLGIALLFILLFPVVRAIVALVLTKANLDVQEAIITNPVNGSFDLELRGFVYNTGMFNAQIDFTEDTHVAWVVSPGVEVPIGHMRLHTLYAKSKRATIQDRVQFIVDDESAFGRFSGALITSNNFTWRMTSYNLRVQALKFPVAKGMTFDKYLTIKGFNNFDDTVTLRDLQLPSDSPSGGINFVAVTELNNPSPFSLDLGTIVFALSYLDVPLGTGTGTNINLMAGVNTIELKGVLIPHTDAKELAAVSQLFTNYLNGDSSPVIARGQTTIRASDGTAISWLTDGLKELVLNVPFKAPGAISPIKTISMGSLALQFDAQRPWEPQAESNTVNARMELPFGFNVSIGQLQNELMIMKNGLPVAGLSTPLGASTSSISVLGPVNTVGDVNITIADTRLSCPDNQHSAFSSFNQELTLSGDVAFDLVGKARAVATMGIGQITLDPIKINVTTHLNGLQGLKGMTTIQKVDVLGGTSEGIQLGIGMVINNPSNLALSIGDLGLQLFRDGNLLGTALVPNLTLALGSNNVTGTSLFKANDSPAGLQTLNDFVGKKNTPLRIAGYDGSTQISSLASALGSLNMDVELPGLPSDLLESASLYVLETTGHTDNIAHVSVALNNPFTTSLHITQIKSSVSAYGISLGSIDQTVAFDTKPQSTTQSPDLNLAMNMDPPSLFTLTRALAIDAGLDPSPIEQMVKLGGYNFVPSTHQRRGIVSRQSSIPANFDLTQYVRQAFAALKSDVSLTTSLNIGDYPTTLQLTQKGLPTKTDETLGRLLPLLARPIVQKIVGNSKLSLDSVMIIDPAQNSFKTKMHGRVSDTGPFDAVISFPSGLTVSWNGQPIGRVSMPDLKVIGNAGGEIDAEATFQVLDVTALTAFTKVLLTQQDFVWQISGENLTVNALGISTPGISFPTQTVNLKGFNGLANGVVIQNFDLPSDDPAGGIHLTLNTLTTNPSQVGIQSSIGFDTYYNDVLIGSVAGPVTLSPNAVSPLPLAGRLVPQTTPAGIAAVAEVFNNFLTGKDSNVVVLGASAGSGDVTWLNEGIRSLRITTILPNRGPQNIIEAIQLSDLAVTMLTGDQAFSPPTTSQHTVAKYKNPFGFSLKVIQAGQTLTLGSEGVGIAQLELPATAVDGGVSTGNVADLVIAFKDTPLKALNPTAFATLFAGVTLRPTVDVEIQGKADVIVRTPIGDIAISNIAFDVHSQLTGIGSFGGRAALSEVVVTGSGNGGQYITTSLKTTLQNPSQISLATVGVSLPVYYNDVAIGRAVIPEFNLHPGANDFNTEFHYQPAVANDTVAQAFLTQFILTQGPVALTIKGDSGSTPFPSLQGAMANLQLGAALAGLNQPMFITDINVVVTLQSLEDNLVRASFTVKNPLDVDLVLETVQCDGGVDGEVYAVFTQTFDNLVVPARGSVNSGIFYNVLLVQGAIKSLEIIPRLMLDVRTAATVRIGSGGYQVPWLKINQDSVPTTYDLVLEKFGTNWRAAVGAMNSTEPVPSTTKAATIISSGGLPASTGEAAQTTTEAAASTPAATTAAATATATPAPSQSAATTVASSVAASGDVVSTSASSVETSPAVAGDSERLVRLGLVKIPLGVA